MPKFPHYRQPDAMDCGPTCLRMIAKYYGRAVELPKLRRLADTDRQGSSLASLSQAAEKIGFRTLGVKIDLHTLTREAPLPCIVHWNQNHFVVVYRIRNGKVHVADPAHGLLVYSSADFIRHWIGPNADRETPEGIALLVEPTPRLNEQEEDDRGNRQNFSFLLGYLSRYQRFLAQLGIGLLGGSLLQLLFPFLTQSVVDTGIQNQDIHFIYLILVAQLFLFVGKTSLEVIRGWILLHLSTRINVSLISDFSSSS